MRLSKRGSAFVRRMRKAWRPTREIIKVSKSEPRGNVAVGLCMDGTMIITVRTGKR